MNGEECTCKNCGNIPCHEARIRLERRGHRLSTESVQTINGFTWRATCARWLPVEEAP